MKSQSGLIVTFPSFALSLFFLASSAFGQTNCVPSPSGLVSWWRGEGNALDFVSGNNGIFSGAMYATAEVGNAFSFPGTTNNVLVPASPSLNVGSGSGLTIECWIFSTDNTYGRPIAEWVSPTVGGYAVHFFIHQSFPGTLYADLYDTSGQHHAIQSAPGLIHTNEFQHVAVTYDKSSGIGRLYIDGAVVEESPLGVFTPDTRPDLSIGYRPSTIPLGPIPFIGSIDELSIYSRALTTNEVRAIYAAGSAGKCTPTLSVCTPASGGLISWWKGDGNALDSVGGNNGTLQNGTGFVPGEVQEAFLFNGSNQWVEIPDSPSLNPSNALTLETWVYVTGNPQTDLATIITKFSPSDAQQNQYQLETHYANGQLNFRPLLYLPSGYAIVDGKTVIQFNTWYHVAMTYDGSALKLYVNGALDGSVAASGAIAPTTQPLRIGGPSNGPWWFNGRVDEVSLYNRPLSASEIAAIYNAGSAGKCTSTTTSCTPAPAGLVSWWPAEGNGFDIVGSNNAVYTNDIAFVPGLSGLAFDFDGTTSAITIPASPSLSVSNLTIETWIFPTDPSTPRPIFEYADASGASALNFWYNIGAGAQPNSGSLFGFARDTVNPNNNFYLSSAGGLVPTNQWSHVAFTFDTAAMSAVLYVNGVIVATNHFGIPVHPNTQLAVNLGYRPVGSSDLYAGFRHKGELDEVSLYNRALAGAEILAIYNAGAAGKCRGPMPPSISVQPRDQTVPVGGSATFSVVANSTQPLAYQWLLGGAAIPNATASALTLTNIQFSNAGAYSVIVSNSAGTVMSSSATLTVNGGSCATPPSGLISWWKGDGNALDSIGGNHGVLENDTNFAPGEVEQAFDFNGINQWLEIPDAPALNPSNALTLETWVYVRGNPNTDLATIVTKFSPFDGQQNQYQLETHYAGGKLNFRPLLFLPSGYAIVDGQTVIQFNSWYHVAMTYDGASLKLYVNGNLDGSAAASGAIAATTQPLRIGGPSSGPWWFNGRVDEASLYDRALSAAEIQAIYGAGSAGKCPVAVAPSLEVQPQSQSATVGTNVTFSAVVAGSLPMSFQWWFNGNPIAGGTNSTLSLDSISQANAGSYSLIAMNNAGAATSSVAVLSVTLAPASIQVAGASVGADGTATVPLILVGNGNENAVGFTIDFDPSLLTYQGVVLGSGASNGNLLINSSQVASGTLGIAVAMPAGVTFQAGTQQLAVASFTAAVVTNATSTAFNFGDTPIKRQVVDVLGATLPANFVSGNLFLAVSGLEGDVFPRPGGDEELNISDWVQVGRYVAGLDSPTNALEFQRADCAPRTTLGDGLLTVSDWVQAGRYAAGLDPAVRAGGPTAPIAEVIPVPAFSSGARKTDSNPRQLTLVAPGLALGQSGTVQVALKAQGDENALAFSISFDPARLAFVNTGASTAGVTLNVNATQAAQGRIGVALALPAGQSFAAGTEQLVNVTFQPVAAMSGAVTLTFGDQPVARGVADAEASVLTADYVGASVVINPLPELKITSSPSAITVSWPTAAAGFVLQEATDPSLPTNGWSAVGTAPVVANNRNVVSLSPSATKRFYRLYHP